jgi:hypothetical protein
VVEDVVLFGVGTLYELALDKLLKAFLDFFRVLLYVVYLWNLQVPQNTVLLFMQIAFIVLTLTLSHFYHRAFVRLLCLVQLCYDVLCFN